MEGKEMETDISINHGSSNLAAHWNLLGFSPREYDLIGLWSVLAMRGIKIPSGNSIMHQN